jgi:hypothetical protein
MLRYNDFLNELSNFNKNNKELVSTILSNIFTMRLIGNKTHGDLAEIAITEMINTYMPAYSVKHVGKELFRAKSKEEDIVVTNVKNNEKLEVSLKAYGWGPLQLSTDKNFTLYPILKSLGQEITNPNDISFFFNSKEFQTISKINILNMIYNESEKKCNILVFDFNKVMQNTVRISCIPTSKKQKHPNFKFFDCEGNYICEVRYGGKEENALQRGFWTNTKKSFNYFQSITNGWVNYEYNHELLNLLSKSLVLTENSHKLALTSLEENVKVTQKKIIL